MDPSWATGLNLSTYHQDYIFRLSGVDLIHAGARPLMVTS